MRLTHLLGLALVAVLVASAVAVSSASAALPELVKAGTSEKVGGEITGKSSGTTIFETQSGARRSCSAATISKGKAVNSKETEGTVVKFTGCEDGFGGTCNSEGASSGEIVSAALKGKIGYLSGTSGEVGLELVANKERLVHGETGAVAFAKFSCLGGSGKNEVYGSVIGLLGKGQHNTSTTSLRLIYTKGSTSGSQEVTKLESGFMSATQLESDVSGGSFEALNWQYAGKLDFAENAELKA